LYVRGIMFSQKIIQNKVYLPEALRRALNVKNGDEVILMYDNESNMIILYKTKCKVDVKTKTFGE
jgi:bifunctional DNA-binding transcriptional regulator/antitoxin component of YhaV-PrlF toxin-antitoxin module